LTGFHSWDEVKHEVFDAEDLDEISAGAERMAAEARAHGSWPDLPIRSGT